MKSLKLWGETQKMELNESPKKDVTGVTHTPTFNETFDQFLIFAERVLQYDTSGEFKLSATGNQANATQTALNGYQNIYNKTRQSPKHIEKFREVYLKCRPLLVKEIPTDNFMEWFEKSTFVITPQEKSRNKIYLTVIFRNCCRIAEHIADEAERDPSKENLLNDPAATYPEHFMLYLFRLFYICADETDRQTMINSRIAELETKLRLGKDEVPAMSDGLNEIFSAARGLAEDIGINVPKDAPPISSNQFREMLGQFTKSDDTKKALKGMFEGVNISDPKQIPNAIGKILGKMQENASKPPEAVRRSMEATADDNIVTVSKS